MFNIKKSIIPSPTPIPPLPISTVNTELDGGSNYKIEYENALKETGLKFLLTVDHHLYEWEINDGRTSNFTTSVKWRNIFFIDHIKYSQYGVLNFYLDQHLFYSKPWDNCLEIPVDSDDVYVKAYIKIKQRIDFDLEQQEYHMKLNNIQHLLGDI